MGRTSLDREVIRPGDSRGDQCERPSLDGMTTSHNGFIEVTDLDRVEQLHKTIKRQQRRRIPVQNQTSQLEYGIQD